MPPPRYRSAPTQIWYHSNLSAREFWTFLPSWICHLWTCVPVNIYLVIDCSYTHILYMHLKMFLRIYFLKFCIRHETMWTTQLRNHSTIICTIFLVLILSWQWDLDNVIVGIVEWDLDNIIVGIVEYRILWCYISAHVVGEGGPEE